MMTRRTRGIGPSDILEWSLALCRFQLGLCRSFSILSSKLEAQDTDLYSVVYSTAYTSGIPGLMAEYHVESETVVTLGSRRIF
jgi:hypothetical protein